MVEYIYENTDKKNLSLMYKKIGKSGMQNKSIQYCTWDEETRILKVYFESELSQADKQILDDIVATTGDEIIIEYPSEIILQSPDGAKKYKITIDNEGIIETSEVQ